MPTKHTRHHRITFRLDDLTLRQINKLMADWPDSFTSSADVISAAVNGLTGALAKRQLLKLEYQAEQRAQLSDK